MRQRPRRPGIHAWRLPLLAALVLLMMAPVAFAATFGKVVQIGGHAADIALDERRGVVYVANFGLRQIDVISMASQAKISRLPLPANPAALAMSPGHRFLVSVNFRDGLLGNGLTVFDLDADGRRDIDLDSPPLAVACADDDFALVVTQTDFRLLEMLTGEMRILTTIEALAGAELARLTAADLPVPFATFPADITRASAAKTGDGRTIYGFAEAGSSDQVFYFAYDVPSQNLGVLLFTSDPDLGPRVVSPSYSGDRVLLGWALLTQDATLLAQFRGAGGEYEFGGHAIDSRRDLIYAQLPQRLEDGAAGNEQPEDGSPDFVAREPGPPELHIVDSDNLTVRERLKLSEHLTGRALLDSSGNTLFAASESGLTIMPIGSLNGTPRIWPDHEDLLFLGSTCHARAMTQTFDVVDPGGGQTQFQLSSSNPAVKVAPASGTTPATIEVSVDYEAFAGLKGTAVALVTLDSSQAVNVPQPVRILVNNREPDQHGTIINIPGRLVDILPDPVRDQFYVLRQDKNAIHVIENSSFRTRAILRTGNTPWSMAITPDNRHLLVANDDSQIANVYDLDTLQQQRFVRFPGGHYPRSIAAAGDDILAASRVAGPEHRLSLIDLPGGFAGSPDVLGVYENKIDEDTVLTASPDGHSIFGAMADGTVIRFDAGVRELGASRKDFDSLQGAYHAPAHDSFIADRFSLNSSLVPLEEFDDSLGATSGAASAGRFLYRTVSPGVTGPGVLQRLDRWGEMETLDVLLAESPVLPEQIWSPFTRTLARLSDGQSLVSLTISGITVLPSDLSFIQDPPRINSVTSAADSRDGVATGGLIRITGENFSSVSASAGEGVWPTVLAETCVSIGEMLIPLATVSPVEIVAQMPFEVAGAAEMEVRSPAGLSEKFTVTVSAADPSIFLDISAGPLTGLAAVFRATNGQVVTLSNPVHPEEWISIFLTGMGITTPAVETGAAAPSAPLAEVTATPAVTLGGVALELCFAGLVPGQVGVYQINAYVPVTAPTGMSIPLVITQGGNEASTSVRVVR